MSRLPLIHPSGQLECSPQCDLAELRAQLQRGALTARAPGVRPGSLTLRIGLGAEQAEITRNARVVASAHGVAVLLFAPVLMTQQPQDSLPPLPSPGPLRVEPMDPPRDASTAPAHGPEEDTEAPEPGIDFTALPGGNFGDTPDLP